MPAGRSETGKIEVVAGNTDLKEVDLTLRVSYNTVEV